MYTSEQEQRLYKQGKGLLTKESADKPEDIISQLIECINYADWKYYVQSEPVFADAEYDALFKKLKDYEERYPEHLSPESPTQRIAKGLSERFPPVAHLVPMLSLDNTYSQEEVREFVRRIGQALPRKTDWCARIGG